MKFNKREYFVLLAVAAAAAVILPICLSFLISWLSRDFSFISANRVLFVYTNQFISILNDSVALAVLLAAASLYSFTLCLPFVAVLYGTTVFTIAQSFQSMVRASVLQSFIGYYIAVMVVQLGLLLLYIPAVNLLTRAVKNPIAGGIAALVCVRVIGVLINLITVYTMYPHNFTGTTFNVNLFNNLLGMLIRVVLTAALFVLAEYLIRSYRRKAGGLHAARFQQI